jgi:hypothetical protein
MINRSGRNRSGLGSGGSASNDVIIAINRRPGRCGAGIPSSWTISPDHRDFRFATFFPVAPFR